MPEKDSAEEEAADAQTSAVCHSGKSRLPAEASSAKFVVVLDAMTNVDVRVAGGDGAGFGVAEDTPVEGMDAVDTQAAEVEDDRVDKMEEGAGREEPVSEMDWNMGNIQEAPNVPEALEAAVLAVQHLDTADNQEEAGDNCCTAARDVLRVLAVDRTL